MLTPDEIAAEPAGPELDAFVAYHLFGWRWFRSKLPEVAWCILQPPDSDGWKRAPWGRDAFAEVPITTVEEWRSLDRATDWNQCGWYCPDGRMPPQKRGVPKFSTDIAAAWSVVERFTPYVMVDARGDGRGKKWSCSVWVGGPELIGNGKTMPLAVCRAALLSVAGA